MGAEIDSRCNSLNGYRLFEMGECIAENLIDAVSVVGVERLDKASTGQRLTSIGCCDEAQYTQQMFDSGHTLLIDNRLELGYHLGMGMPTYLYPPLCAF